jgi:hypothetical protein
MRELPFGLKAVCIIAIVFGALGILGGGLGLLGLFMRQHDAAAQGSGPQAELNQRLLEQAKKLRPVQIVLVPTVMAISVLLLAAGIAGLKLQALGFIRLAFAASLVADSIAAAYGISAQVKTMDLMKDFIRNSKSDSSVAMGMQIGFSVGLFFAVGWLVAKVGFYVAGLAFFSKRSVREAFSPPPPPVSP